MKQFGIWYHVKYWIGSILLIPIAIVLNLLRWIFGK